MIDWTPKHIHITHNVSNLLVLTHLIRYKHKRTILQWSQYVPSNVMTPPSVLLTHLLEPESYAASAWTIFPIIKVGKCLNSDDIKD